MRASPGRLSRQTAGHVITAPTPWYHKPEVGFWFFALAITTAIAAVAAVAERPIELEERHEEV